MKKNLDLRRMAKSQKVKLWQIAEKLAITDTWFSRRLRQEFPEHEKVMIRFLIDEIAVENREKEMEGIRDE